MSTGRRNFRMPRKGSDAANDASSDVGGTEYLETLLGYNARRAALTLVGNFMQGVAEFDLRPVDFSILSVIGHSPGVTSRQLCQLLNVLPPNMVVLLRQLDRRGLIERHPTRPMVAPWACRSAPPAKTCWPKPRRPPRKPTCAARRV